MLSICEGAQLPCFGGTAISSVILVYFRNPGLLLFQVTPYLGKLTKTPSLRHTSVVSEYSMLVPQPIIADIEQCFSHSCDAHISDQSFRSSSNCLSYQPIHMYRCGVSGYVSPLLAGISGRNMCFERKREPEMTIHVWQGSSLAKTHLAQELGTQEQRSCCIVGPTCAILLGMQIFHMRTAYLRRQSVEASLLESSFRTHAHLPGYSKRLVSSSSLPIIL